MSNKGFTLLELSIVIVIIGLIVAGISAGQSLVRQAQLKSIGSELANFSTAINSFKLQYDDIPGDMPNAYDYWGAPCDATPANCNGDGDGIIEAAPFESLRSMQHMALAGLLDTQVTLPSTICDAASCPSSQFSPGLYTFRGGDSQIFGGANVIILGAERDLLPLTVLFTPAEIQAIDNKRDDGLAALGQIRGWPGRNLADTAWSSTCMTPNGCHTSPTANCAYDLDTATAQCAMFASP